MACGRVRKEIGNGWTSLVDGELKNLKMGVINLQDGDSFRLETHDNEYACVLISGECELCLESGGTATLGPKKTF